MKKNFNNPMMYLTMFMALLFVMGSTAVVFAAGTPNPGFLDGGGLSGPAIMGTVTYNLDDGTYVFSNGTCMGKPVPDFQGEHYYEDADELTRSNIVNTKLRINTVDENIVEELGNCLPPTQEYYPTDAVDLAIKAASNIHVIDDTNTVSADVVLLFIVWR